VVAPGSEGLSEVVDAFGSAILGPDGALDRKALAALVFGNEENRKRLNAITHPRITRLTLGRSAELAQRGEPLACYEAALIVENGVEDMFRPLVVVSTPESEQVARIVARDGLSEPEALARIRSQKPLKEKVRVADFVVDTTGSVDELQGKVDELLTGICAKVGVDRTRYGGTG